MGGQCDCDRLQGIEKAATLVAGGILGLPMQMKTFLNGGFMEVMVSVSEGVAFSLQVQRTSSDAEPRGHPDSYIRELLEVDCISFTRWSVSMSFLASG